MSAAAINTENDPKQCKETGEGENDDLLASFMTSVWVPTNVDMNYLSNHDLSLSTTVTASHKKKIIVNNLKEYWKLKGLLLRIKRTPTLLNDDRTLKIIVKFLENHTELSEFSFWNKLDLSQKYNIAKKFSVIDSSAEKQTITTSSLSPEVFVVLSGKVVAKQTQSSSDTEHEVTFKHGSVFGLTQAFDDIIDPPPESKLSVHNNLDIHYQSEYSQYKPPSYRLEAAISLCTLFKLNLKDYQSEFENKEIDFDTTDFDGIPNYMSSLRNGMSIEDFECLQFCNETKKCLSPTLYKFLLESDILPKNSTCPSYQYLKVGNMGRKILLNKEDPKTVFIIVDGSITFQITKGGSVSSSYELNCRREGQPSLNLKTSYLPVMTIEVGSIFVVNDSCFNIKEATIEEDIVTSGQGLASASTSQLTIPSIVSQPISRKASVLNHNPSLYSKIDTNMIAIIEAAMSINAPVSKLNSRRRNRFTDRKQENSDLYQLQIVFDKPAKYLAIPMETFKLAMKETSIELNKEISVHLNLISKSIVNRIKTMLPWIYGRKELWLMDPPIQKKKVLPAIEKTSITCPQLGPITMHEMGIEHTYGSFFSSAVKTSECNSI